MTITEAFDSQMAFEALLRGLNFPEDVVTRLINNEGIETPRDLTNMKPDRLSSALELANRLPAPTDANPADRAYFSSSRIDKLMALCAYLRRCLSANRIPDIRLITPQDISVYITYLDSWRKKPDKVQDILSNYTLKFDPNDFVKFRQMIETLTSSLYGVRSITINYLLRANDNDTLIEEADPDINSVEFMTDNASLSGNEYSDDNRTLYTILRHFLTNTPGWNVISRYSREGNGRAAYLALRKHYEGASYHESMKTKANAMLMRTFYRGGANKFTWEKFVAVHLEAHRMFADIGEPLSDSMKILYLKGGIRDESGLVSSMEVAKGLPHTRNNFEEYVNHLTESVSTKRSRSEIVRAMNTRYISANETARGRGRGRGRSRFPGRFSGRGRGRGRAPFYARYNAHSNSSKSNIPESIIVEGKTLYPRRVYRRAEYDQLSLGQRSALKEARAKVSSIISKDTSTLDTRSIASALSRDLKHIWENSNENNAKGGTKDNCENNIEKNDESISSQFKRRRAYQN